ncbi:Pentatricopeptide repeat-containing protein [Acorus calamus]|uniref:Pentatricopeptide repeat-containing protein n=1 Tax=Acorus calamus TaxID=4465 RepID=A0AAV9BYJ6_ACOCL|nr:Pentatricopeptide repeat-containing protein [Acorus calamus]
MRLMFEHVLSYPFKGPWRRYACCQSRFKETAKTAHETTQKGGSLRGRGWKYGSGFVDGIFPVLSPVAQEILTYVQKEVESSKVWASLDNLAPTHATWDDLINVAVQLRLNKQWIPIVTGSTLLREKAAWAMTALNKLLMNQTVDHTHSSTWLKGLDLPATGGSFCCCQDDQINLTVGKAPVAYYDGQLCEWILHKSSFQPDVMCYNLLIDAYGHKGQFKKAESLYLKLVEARCIPTEDTYALLIRAFCTSGLIEKAGAVFAEMRKYGIPRKHTFYPGAIVYNAYIDGLMKGQNNQKAVEVFQRMKNDQCQPNADTYTLLINLYGKANQSVRALKIFNEMRTEKCKPNICTYTALINAFAREGLCEKAEEYFERLQEAGYEPDVYAYNALMEAYSRAGFPNGASEIFSLMQHMGCEPDRASYNIMVDAYGRAGLHEDARAVFQELKHKGMTPTMKSHMLLLSAYSKAGEIGKCEDIMNQMHKSGLTPDTFVLNSMLNAYGRAGQFQKMEDVLDAMERGPYRADISTYNILINIYGRSGFFDRMEELFNSLSEKKLKPDVKTWTSRIGAYSRKKRYMKCLEIFEEMVDSGCYPDGGTAKVLLAACSSEDQIEQITTVIRTMHKEARTLLPI